MHVQTTRKFNNMVWIVKIRSCVFVSSPTNLPYLLAGPEGAFFLKLGFDPPDWTSSIEAFFAHTGCDLKWRASSEILC